VRDAEGGETTPSFGHPSNVRRGETTPSFGHPSNVRRGKGGTAFVRWYTEQRIAEQPPYIPPNRREGRFTPTRSAAMGHALKIRILKLEV